MYQAFYRLQANPFRLSSDPSLMYMTMHHREALAGLVYSACTRPGLTALVGEAGTGKTTLLYALLDLLERRRAITAMCTNPTLTREEFFDCVITKFRVESSSHLKSRQLDALQEALLRNQADGRASVLIVDEAQRLSAELLEEIRLLLNLETPREKLLQIIISGQPELGEVLRRPELRQLKQRVSTICKLKPLNLIELREYILFRLKKAGSAEETLFQEPAFRLIYEYTQGIPRLINTLCDGALQTGCALQAPQITPAIIEEVAADLELVRMKADEAPANGHKPAAPAAAKTTESPVTASNGGAPEKAPTRAVESAMPMESYLSRQKSMGFFASLMDRWK